ncbi:pilus assembly FimT family protein [Iodidimonas gelatinilytica]|uniref:pilus assembly FimT family protein n=1 Tax=Iodidimonas gelatinilytica TaxID=1236966 RepID=UPI001230BC40|nr:prepilin-type N-terminal cleavage/methylation domain-containing protein [Iodidimonas gelatinilytica]
MRIYPPHARHKKPLQRGFTLFEMLVVLAIMGLILGLAAPQFTARIESGKLIEMAESIATQMREAPMRARLDGRTIRYGSALQEQDDGLAQGTFELDPGWTVRTNGTLIVSAMGLCSGGELQIFAPSGRNKTIIVTAPFCETRIVDAPQRGA